MEGDGSNAARSSLDVCILWCCFVLASRKGVKICGRCAGNSSCTQEIAELERNDSNIIRLEARGRVSFSAYDRPRLPAFCCFEVIKRLDLRCSSST